MSATTQAPSRGRLWGHRAFMLFWSGETVSLFGTQVTLLALPLTAVLTLNATASQLGFIRFVEQLPYLLFTLLFGAWVDRRRRRPVMILANAARALLIVLVPLFAVFGLLQLWLLAAIAFAVGIFSVLFDLTWLAYVPALITSDEFVEANGKVATSASAAEVAGPGLGGLLVQLLSAPVALLADAVSYVVATITLVAIRAPEPAPHVQLGQRGRLLRDIGLGISVVWRNLNLRAIMVMSGLWNLLFSIADTAFVLYAVRELHLGAGTLGAIYAVGAIGGLIGSAVSTRLGQRGRFGPVLGIAFTFGTVPWLLLPAAAGPIPLEVALFTLAYFLVRTGLGLWSVLVLSYRQAVTPLHLLGRVGASLRFVSYGLGALGFLLASGLTAVLSLHVTLWLAAGGFVAILLVVLLATPLPRLRSLPTAPDPALVEDEPTVLSEPVGV
ncbi:MAG TPA: MFS transporter [Ktedonobacterales bacterium]|nr:MFS transporter [Ktedonobacterales bacterium]